MAEPRTGRLVRELDGAAVRQEWGTVTENAVRLDREDAARMVEALNADHAGAFNLFYVLRKHYWTAEGAEHEDVADVLKAQYERARELNDDLAERITTLGGVPASTPPTLQEYAPVHLEAEHHFDLAPPSKGTWRPTRRSPRACVSTSASPRSWVTRRRSNSCRTASRTSKTTRTTSRTSSRTTRS
ncbi:hypothetical protein J2752_001485 [Halarchaeum rubridurum]|uniref:Ferritin/DPS domain-containing protein n=1 Tax=Halarchaeum rubridurum TaxID=489911 RepID=A0A8T4GQR7_9EURY|nr:hypothetical protein [Halarchaeum rubridurum]